MLVVNIFGGMDSDESVKCACSYVLKELKKNGVNVKTVMSFDKNKHCRNNSILLNNFSKQYSDLIRLNEKVDVVITNSHLLDAVIYKENIYPFDKYFSDFIIHVYNSFDTLNYLIGSKEDSYSKSYLDLYANLNSTLSFSIGDKKFYSSIVEDVLYFLNHEKK